MEVVDRKNAVKWHRLPFLQFVKYEASRPMFRPFLYGAVISLVVVGILPTLGATEEDKRKSQYWRASNGIHTDH